MPGLLSSIFEGSNSDDTGNAYQDQRQSTGDDGGEDAGSGNDHASSSYAVGGDGEVEASPSVTVSNTMSGSYETPDGTTHSWERSDEVTLTTDTHLGATADAILTVDDQIY